MRNRRSYHKRKRNNHVATFGLIGILVFVFLIIVGAKTILRYKSATSNAANQEESDNLAQNTDTADGVSENQDEEHSDGVIDQAAYRRGYDLPIADSVKAAANEESIAKLSSLQEALPSDLISGNAQSVLSADQMKQLMEQLAVDGQPVFEKTYGLNMINASEMSQYLENCRNQEQGELVAYELHTNGTIGRYQYSFDGQDMYVLYTSTSWIQNRAVAAIDQKNRVDEWQYTQDGWFQYELCEPQTPDVTERFNGNVLLRLHSIEESYCSFMDQYLLPIGYQLSNLFCSDWDQNQLDQIDYSGLYEAFYKLKYGEKFTTDSHVYVPAEEFEALIMEYLPVTVNQLRAYEGYDSSTNSYEWKSMGCGNYAPNAFGLSIPEITDMTDNGDGTMTISINAVCEFVGNQKLMTHQLTVSIDEDGGIHYLKNQILEGSENIPAYEYRLSLQLNLS